VAHQQVAAVEVTVEDPEQGGSFEERDHERPYHRRGVDASAAHPLDVVPAETVEAFHDEETAGDELGVRPRDDHRFLACRGQDAGDVEHVVGFEAEI
jgi:hypothetical protein